MISTEQLLDFLKTGMGTATQISDELLRQFTNYLLVSTALNAIVTGLVVTFLYQALTKTIKTFAEDKVSQGWAKGVAALRVLLVVGAIIYSYTSVSKVLEPLVAPHVWLLKQGVGIKK